MAGATVFQLETSPIAEEDLMTEAHVYDTPFYNSVADYVCEVEDRDAAELYLADLLSFVNKDHELVTITRNDDGRIATVTFRDGFREAFFAPGYVTFMKLLAELTVVTTPAAFTDGKIEMQLFMLRSAYDDEFSDYVFTNECEFITLDEFIRTVKIDTPYHLGGIMGYHF